MIASSSTGKTLRRAAGRVLIAGLEGQQLTAMEASWLKLIRPGGVILFRRNVETAEQTYALLQAARNAADEPLLCSIDVEGGSVDRLRDLIAPTPSAYAVGATREPFLFETHGRLIGRAVRLLGLDATFAPVLDLKTSLSDGVMGSRTVSAEAAEVIAYAKGFLKGLAQEGALGCGKHFPGLGSGRVDSHHSTPAIEKPFEGLWKEDLLPYRELAGQLALIMISHASYPLTPSGAEPASISRFWTTEILRKKIGYRGLIVSDDMEMGGILSRTGMADAAVRCLLAGAHLIEICRDPALLLIAYEALLAEAEGSPAFSRRLFLAARKVEAFEDQHRKSRRPLPAPTGNDVRELREEILRFSQQVGQPA